MNTKKTQSHRRRPQVEALESMLLLSTFGSEMLHAAKAMPVHVAPAPPVIALTGTIHATGKVTGATSGTATGSGNLGKVGTASFKLAVDLASPPTSVTLSTKHGKIYVGGANGILGSTTSGSGTYTILGGTGSYIHATGSGHVSGSYSLLKGGKLSISITFS